MAQDALSTSENGNAAITLTPETLQQLNSLVFSVEALKRAGYTVNQLTEMDLEQKKRCPTCGVRIAKRPRTRDRQSPDQDQPASHRLAEAQQPKDKGSDSTSSGNVARQNTGGEAHPKLPRCNFHPGKTMYRAWTCCGKHVAAAPCTGKEDHDAPRAGEAGAIERRWQFYETPSNTKPSHRSAVAIDCEMGSAFDDDRELIRLTVIDYFSAEVLIDSLVYPDVPMKHFNTRWSGVTRGDMERSRRRGQCIMGKAAARRAIFRYVGPSTIVVGHGAQNDLSSLRWIHHRVVDSYMVESASRKEAELKAELENAAKEGDGPRERGLDSNQKDGKRNPDGMSLKALAMKRLGRAIQVGKKGHDSLEDALAARDLIHAHVTDLGISASLADLSVSGDADETALAE
ncbi:hypothetical protein B0J18DRAFT_116805 [Chaetomium sp. MPI-SDFR-AT-0129]|nr:hypothetical protein B0J18DRAFT_116805 [Chaetomium sp. MPI-SDFR-AT-0129]